MGFDPWNRFLKIREYIWGSNSHIGNSFGSLKVHSLTLFCITSSMRCDYRASFLALNLASLCLGCEPKVGVAIECVTSPTTSIVNVSFDGGDRHPPFIDLDVHILVQLVIGCVHVVMVNGDVDTNIANEHLHLCRLLRHQQVMAL
jgi:hypothetical protein